MRIVVVFPAPLGPSRPKTTPPGYLKRQVGQGHGLPPPPQQAAGGVDSAQTVALDGELPAVVQWHLLRYPGSSTASSSVKRSRRLPVASPPSPTA